MLSILFFATALLSTFAHMPRAHGWTNTDPGISLTTTFSGPGVNAALCSTIRMVALIRSPPSQLRPDRPDLSDFITGIRLFNSAGNFVAAAGGSWTETGSTPDRWDKIGASSGGDFDQTELQACGLTGITGLAQDFIPAAFVGPFPPRATSYAERQRIFLIFRATIPAGVTVSGAGGPITGDGREYDLLFDINGPADGVPTATLSITPANAPPAIITNPIVSVAENQTDVIDVDANDPEGGSEANGRLSYAVTGSIDDAFFAIDANTGILTFLTAPDFEAPANRNADNNYVVQVTVTDSGGLASVQNFVVTVTDVDEVPPVLFPVSIASDNGVSAATARDGDTVILTFAADEPLAALPTVTTASQPATVSDTSSGALTPSARRLGCRRQPRAASPPFKSPIMPMPQAAPV